VAGKSPPARKRKHWVAIVRKTGENVLDQGGRGLSLIAPHVTKSELIEGILLGEEMELIDILVGT